MGIIHHAAYLPYLEEARVEYLRQLGHPYGEVRGGGHNFAVLEVSVRYRRPLEFDELVEVHLKAGALTATAERRGCRRGSPNRSRSRCCVARLDTGQDDAQSAP